MMKETEMKRVPKLRFPEFTDDWEQRKVGETITEVSRPIELNDYQEYQLVTVKRRNEGIVSRGKMYGKNILVKKYFEIHAGDYLISKRQLVHGANGIVPKNLDNAVVSNEYMACVSNEFVTAEFLTLLSKTKSLQRDFFLSSYGVDIEKLVFDVEDWKKRSIIIPEIEEQNKIYEYFSHLDHLITLHQRKLKKLNVLKKGVMQKLFSQEVRFKADDGSEFPEWEKKPFGDVVSEFKVKTKVEDEDTLLSCAINGMFLNSELFGHQRGQSNIGYLKIKKGTLILSAQNLHLGNANVNLRFEHGIISPAYKTYDIVGCSAEYMSQWAKWDMTKQFFYNATTVGASECRRNVDWNMLYSQLFAVPCLAEQQKIAECLSALDDVIEKQKATLAAWEELKKGLLQQMFV